MLASSLSATASGGASGNLAALTPRNSARYVYDDGQNGLYPNRSADVVISVTNPSSNKVGVVITSVIISVVPAASNPN